MPTKRHKKVSDLFRAACELDAGARDSFLDQACGSDASLRAEVEALLAQDDQHPSFLATAAQSKDRRIPQPKNYTNRPTKPVATQAPKGEDPKREPSQRPHGLEQIGDFRIERRLGGGSMGTVYLARQLSLDRFVALKVLGSALTRQNVIVRFQREAQAVAKLHHPGIAAIHYIGQDEEVCYLAMEWVDGPSLRQVITCLASTREENLNLNSTQHLMKEAEAPRVRFDRPADDAPTQAASPHEPDEYEDLTEEARNLVKTERHIRRSCEIIRDAAHALAHAHTQGVTHRDIKPENLMLDPSGAVRLIDFGIARFFEDATITHTGQLVGTPLYMSPEQVTARVPVDHRTDIYSLGMVFYELLTLQSPLEEQTCAGILRKIVTKELPPVSWKNPGVSQRVEAVVHKATSKDPDDRYATAAEFARDLQRVLDGGIVSARPYRYKTDRTEIESTRPRSVLLLVVVVLAFGFLFSSSTILIGFRHWTIGGVWSPTLQGLFGLTVGPALLVFGWALLGGFGWARWLGLGVATELCLFSGHAMITNLPESSSLSNLYFYVLTLSAYFLMSLAIPLVLFRRNTREWFARVKEIRAECKELQASLSE